MTNSNEKVPLIIRLKYKKNDLIIKEGDYGVSIYEIIEGKVKIFTEAEDVSTTLATLEGGQIFGEMAFLSGGMEPRAASARAVEDTTIEVWHSQLLKREYSEMPPVLKLMINQTLKRLIRMNKTVAEFHARRVEEERMRNLEKPGSKRRFFRRKVEIPCTYRPLRGAATANFQGLIRDISQGGARMETNVSAFSGAHIPGDQLIIKLTLPPDVEMELFAEIVNIRKTGATKFIIGMSFLRLSLDDQKKLGFFLMPYGQRKTDQKKYEIIWP